MIVDGLAYGAMPEAAIRALARRPLALCHHPLAHEPGLQPSVAARLRESERAALALSAHVFVTSAETKRTLLAEFGLADEKVTVAPPGLDHAKPARGRAGAPTVLCVASFTPRKGHLALVAALAMLPPEVEWRAVFSGPEDRSPETAAAVRRAVAEAGLGGRIEFAGAGSRGALDRLYDEATIFALASTYEGYGMVFAEAMMRTLPIAAFDLPTLREMAPPEALRLAPMGDVAALSVAIEGLLRDPAARREAGAAGRRAALAMPGWEGSWEIVRGALERMG